MELLHQYRSLRKELRKQSKTEIALQWKMSDDEKDASGRKQRKTKS